MALCVLAASRAGALDARVGWLPVQSVAGYRLYVRLSGQTYGPGVDVGLLPPDPDGVIRYVTRGLPTGVINYFAVTAYDASGRESAFSNELSLMVVLTPTPTANGAGTATIAAPAATGTSTAIATRTATPLPSAPSTATRTPAATAIATATPSPTTTRAPTTTGATIWAATAAPGNAAQPDSSAVELGVKFTSEVNGLITGIRFYKSATNTGAHTGTLWSSAGAKLATAVFTNETASGWQQVAFATPVAITANTVYVASYHTDVGYYAGDVDYFATAGVDNPPLHALDGGVSGGNGLYVYGPSAFPTNTFRSINYWVDVVFAAAPAAMPTPARTSTRTGTPVPTSTWTPTATPSPTFPGPRYAISGHISYYADGAPVPDTTLTLQGALGTLTAASDAAGAFGFAGINSATWQLEPQKQGDQRNGVSALDASHVLQRLAGAIDFDALQTLACEVTGNGSLSALDAVRILQFTVGEIDRLPVAAACGSDWVFIPQPLFQPGELVTQPVPGETTCLPGSVRFAPLSGDAPQQDFTALLFGDCTGNWNGSSGAALRRRAGSIRARLDARPRPGQRWIVELHIDGDQDLDALEAHVRYDPTAATLEDVHVVGPASDALLHYRDDTSGMLSIALASDHPLETGTRPLVVFVFSAADAPQVRLLDAVVDDSPVSVAD